MKPRGAPLNRLVRVSLTVLLLTVLTNQADSQSNAPPVPPDWLTHAERTDYRETPDYETTLRYCRKLAAASPLLRLTDFGRSGEGRPLALVVAATGNDFTPAEARKAGKVVVLVQANIH